MREDSTFSTATTKDAQAIVEINNSHMDSDDPNGFLVVHLTLLEVLDIVETNRMTFY